MALIKGIVKHKLTLLCLVLPFALCCTSPQPAQPRGTSATSGINISDIAARARIYGSQFQKYRSINGYTRYNSTKGSILVISATISGNVELDGQILVNGSEPLKSSVKDGRLILGMLNSCVHINASIQVEEYPSAILLEYVTDDGVISVSVSPIRDDPDLGFFYVDKDVVFGPIPNAPRMLIESKSKEFRAGYVLVGVDKWAGEIRYYFLNPLEE